MELKNEIFSFIIIIIIIDSGSVLLPTDIFYSYFLILPDVAGTGECVLQHNDW